MVARSGFLYAGIVFALYVFMLWSSAVSLRQRVDDRIWLACAGLIALWGFASHLDDEHWLYHIPFVSLFFVPVVLVWMEACGKEGDHAA